MSYELARNPEAHSALVLLPEHEVSSLSITLSSTAIKVKRLINAVSKSSCRGGMILSGSIMFNPKVSR